MEPESPSLPTCELNMGPSRSTWAAKSQQESGLATRCPCSTTLTLIWKATPPWPTLSLPKWVDWLVSYTPHQRWSKSSSGLSPRERCTWSDVKTPTSPRPTLACSMWAMASVCWDTLWCPSSSPQWKLTICTWTCMWRPSSTDYTVTVPSETKEVCLVWFSSRPSSTLSTNKMQSTWWSLWTVTEWAGNTLVTPSHASWE